MNYDIGHIKEMGGTLIIRDESIVIQDVHIQMDAPTARKLASVLCSNKVTREHQKLFFTSVMIDKKDLNTFTKGQSGIEYSGSHELVDWPSPHRPGGSATTE